MKEKITNGSFRFLRPSVAVHSQRNASFKKKEEKKKKKKKALYWEIIDN
jgi:hypothetical protein